MAVRAVGVVWNGESFHAGVDLAAALGTPVVGLYGPTDPDRNGPWLREDVTVSRFSRCRCRYRRRCRMVEWCLGEATVDDVTAAIRERLGT